MKLTLAQISTLFTLSCVSTASAHAFNSCWLLAGSTINEQICLDVDVPDAYANVCMPTDSLRVQVERMSATLAGGDDLKSVKVSKPYTCYFFTGGNCEGNVQGNKLGTDYVQVLGGSGIFQFYPGIVFRTFRCDK